MLGPRTKIESISIKGFRSLADIEISGLPDVTVMIGANGSGKSNIIRFFDMLSWMLKSRRLAEFVARHGGADDQLFGGSKKTPSMEATVSLLTGDVTCEFSFSLAHAHPDRIIITKESLKWSKGGEAIGEWTDVSKGKSEASLLLDDLQRQQTDQLFYESLLPIAKSLMDLRVYHFHDTSEGSNIKKSWDIDDNHHLRSHGGNLAAVLHRLEDEDVRRFDLICRHIGRILPPFDRFEIEESYGKVSLRWKAKSTDKTFGAHLTSDGSLRTFALVTLLNLPPVMLPSVILLDEPELGLHPAAIGLVAQMIKQLSCDKQIIVATQSPLLVDEFGLEKIVVLDLDDGRTRIRKLSTDDYKMWLDQDYTPSQLWQKNVLGGRP